MPLWDFSKLAAPHFLLPKLLSSRCPGCLLPGTHGGWPGYFYRVVVNVPHRLRAQPGLLPTVFLKTRAALARCALSIGELGRHRKASEFILTGPRQGRRFFTFGAVREPGRPLLCPAPSSARWGAAQGRVFAWHASSPGPTPQYSELPKQPRNPINKRKGIFFLL